MSRTKGLRLLFFICLFLLAWGERVFFDLGPNVEFVTVAMLVASYYLGLRAGIALSIFSMIFSDVLIGNSSIFIFTWTGFLIPAVVGGNLFRSFRERKAILSIGLGTTVGLGTTLFFYLWTNFGVWLLDSWGMYTNDLSGLLLCYINGLPFLRMQLTGTLLFVPLGFTLVELGKEFLLFGASRISMTLFGFQSSKDH